MSEKERHYMWNLGFALAVKYPAIARGTYHTLHSIITVDGICMRPGYALGKGSTWDTQKGK